MKIIAVANQKGGVGKTTTALAMASILTKRGKKVLFVDADTQCNGTDTFCVDPEGIATLYDVILDLDDPCPIEEAIVHTQSGDILPGDPQLRKADDVLSSVQGGYFRLREVLRKVSGYDYIIIDTNPAINTMLRNALIAADEVIIPVTVNRYDSKGLSQMTETIASISANMENGPKIAGLLLVMYRGWTRKGKAARELYEPIANEIGTRLFKTVIRTGVDVEDAQIERKMLIDYAPRSKPERDYEAFVDEYFGKGGR